MISEFIRLLKKMRLGLNQNECEIILGILEILGIKV